METEKKRNKEIERNFIPSLREGVDLVKMILFKTMKEYLAGKYDKQPSRYCSMLAGAIMNKLFNSHNPDEQFVLFVEENKEFIGEELHGLAQKFPDLRILLTDALRVHFLCNHQEGLEEGNEAMLARAKEYGILIEERDVPLPKGFMELVHRVGRANGLVE